MAGYTKLFSSIIASTVWSEPNPTRIVWITMLAMANRQGVVESSLPGLAVMARVNNEECETAIRCLESPDKYSRTKDDEGRRIRPVDGGWLIINHEKYRNMLSLDDRRDYKTAKQREYRKRAVDNVDKFVHGGHIAEAEAEATPDKDLSGAKNAPENIGAQNAPQGVGQRAVQVWNDNCGTLPKVRSITKGRQAKISARIRSDGEFLEKLETATRIAANSPFLLGDSESGWRADFDWMISNDTNICKVLEGKYERGRRESAAERRTRRNLEIAGFAPSDDSAILGSVV